MLKRRDLVAGILLSLFSLFFLYRAFLLPGNPNPGQPGPGLFPKLVLFAILCAAFILFYQDMKKDQKSLPVRLNLKNTDMQKTIFILTTAIAYIFFMGKIHFILITFIFLIISMQTLKSGLFPNVLIRLNKLPQIIIVSSLVTIGIYFIFEAFLMIPLP